MPELNEAELQEVEEQERRAIAKEALETGRRSLDDIRHDRVVAAEEVLGRGRVLLEDVRARKGRSGAAKIT